MSQIRGKWTKHERALHNYLKGRKIKHQMYPKMEGNPDIILKDKKVAIFIDGCFWHGCPRCYTEPSSNVDYWKKKIARNRANDIRSRKILRNDGWKVLRFWEHEFKNNSVGAVLKKTRKL